MIPKETQLDRVFHALADSTRRQILQQIGRDDVTVSEISARYDMSMPAISKHLNVLEQAGLVKRKRDGRKRLCSVQLASMDNALDWLESYRQFWDGQLENLKWFVESQHTTGRKK